jgi:hypothetical protein
MSKHDPDALKILAEWRRAGFGVWRMTFVIEGFDDEHVHMLPGRLSERRAIKHGTRECAMEYDVKPRFVHLKDITKDT